MKKEDYALPNWFLKMNLFPNIETRDLASNPSGHFFGGQSSFEMVRRMTILDHFTDNFGRALLFKKMGNFKILAKSQIETNETWPFHLPNIIVS